MSSYFDLPETHTEFPPAFLTVSACSDWLVLVPLANPAQAQVMLLRQLNLLHRYTLANSARLKLLETMRQTVIEVQRDVAKKFANRPLPLNPTEQAAFDGTLAVWQALLGGYLRLLDAVAAGDTTIIEQGALIAQRSLSVFADWEVDLCRGEKLPDVNFWRRLHKVFALAEQLKLISLPVRDAARHGNEQTTALAAYAESRVRLNCLHAILTGSRDGQGAGATNLPCAPTGLRPTGLVRRRCSLISIPTGRPDTSRAMFRARDGWKQTNCARVSRPVW